MKMARYFGDSVAANSRSISDPLRISGHRRGRLALGMSAVMLRLALPFALRAPLAFDGKLLGQVVRIFTDTVASWYKRWHVDRGLPTGESGAVTVIQRANSDLRLNPHLHTISLDGVYSPDGDGKGRMIHPAPAPTQDEVEALVCRASKRILRFLQRRGVISPVAAPGEGEVTVVTDETMGEKDPLLASLLAAATAGAVPA